MDLAGVFCAVFTASVVACAIAVLVWLFGRVGESLIPRSWSYALWLIFVARLLWPLLETGFKVLMSAFGAGASVVVAASRASGLEQTFLAASTAASVPSMSTGAASHFQGAVISPAVSAASNFFPLNIFPQIPVPAHLGSVLAIVWVVGAVVGLFALAVTSLGIRRRLREASVPFEGPVYRRFSSCVRRRLPRRKVTLILSPDLAGPAVYGLFRPKVCLPVDLAVKLDEQALDHVFEHELTHIRRGDQVLNCLLLTIRAVYWFNPLVWMACMRIERLRELACDEAVVATLGASARRAYGQTLLSVAASTSPRRNHYPVPGLARHTREIRQRIEGIGAPVTRHRVGAALVTICVAIALFFGLVHATEPLLSTRQKSWLPAALVAAGSFSTNGKEVRISSFFMAQTEITQIQYQGLMGKNPSWFSQEPDAARRPVEQVSWFDAVEFCNKLSIEDGLEPVYSIEGKEVNANFSRSGWRLPTEAEWEFAARGGANSHDFAWAGSDSVGDVAWYQRNSGGVPHPVATKLPNELGLYDMSGNAAEWCQDLAGNYPSDSTDPLGATSGWGRVVRGGTSSDSAYLVSLPDSGSYDPWSASNRVGFRVVRRGS